VYGACSSPDARSARRISYVIGWGTGGPQDPPPAEAGRILAAYPSVSPASHAREVIEFLESRRA